MKCISKFVRSGLVCLLIISMMAGLSGCSLIEDKTSTSYDLVTTSQEFGLLNVPVDNGSSLMGQQVSLPSETDLQVDLNPDPNRAYAAGVFNQSKKEVLYAENMTQKVYPASTTKILTAYVALKYGNLDDVYTVSPNAVNLTAGSSLAHVNAGDQLSLRQLLYGLMLPSGNDAAVAIAEGVSGSIESFVDLMNQEAHALGATHSHFVTVNGLHDDDHYTTVYDMYLIFTKAIENADFLSIISAKTYDATYTAADGSPVQKTWKNTNHYLTGSATAPETVTVIGGKTGKTDEAQNCLVLLSMNKNNEQVISIIYRATYRTEMYQEMTDILNAVAGV